MTPAMIETAIALLLAHVLADFVFQTKAMVAAKRRPTVLLGHALVVAALNAAALGGAAQLALAVAFAHLLIDAVKTYLAPDSLAAFLLDQAAHLGVIAAAAWVVPDAMASGLWANAPDWVPRAALVVTGFVTASLAGGPAIALLMKPYAEDAVPEGLAHGGRLIGLLERALIVLLVISGNHTGIGFLIAAKSILRFDVASESRAAGEYVIIGTLASFAWALAVSYAMMAALDVLPPF